MLGRALPKSKTPTFELIEKLLYDSNVVALELTELGAGFTMVQKKLTYIRINKAWTTAWDNLDDEQDYMPILDMAYHMLSPIEDEHGEEDTQFHPLIME